MVASALPPELRTRLEQATVSADLDRILSLLSETEHHHPDIAHALRRRAEAFEYQDLLDLLKPPDRSHAERS